MKLDDYKGIEIGVNPNTGQFYTEEPSMKDEGLEGIKKQIRSIVIKSSSVKGSLPCLSQQL